MISLILASRSNFGSCCLMNRRYFTRTVEVPPPCSRRYTPSYRSPIAFATALIESCLWLSSNSPYSFAPKPSLHEDNAQFIPMDQLVEILRMKDVSTSAMSAYKHLTKCNLVGIDDIMLMPMKKEEAVAFFNLVNLLYENASLVITTNKAPTEWVEILQDEVLATALLDRILYHCDIIKLTGSSYRMENRSGFLNKNTYSSTSNQQKK